MTVNANAVSRSDTYADDNVLAAVSTPKPIGSGRATISYGCDGAGRVTVATDRGGATTTATYGLDGTLTRVTTTPKGAVADPATDFGYDAVGHRTTVTVGLGSTPLTTTTGYNTDGTLAQVTDPAGDTTRYGYDHDGQPTTVSSPSATAADPTNPFALVTVNTYTSDNLLASTRTPVVGTAPGTGTWRVSDYGYDPAGRRTSTHTYEATSGDGGQSVNPLAGRDGGAMSVAYYPDGRVASQTGRPAGALGQTDTANTSYDAAGHPTLVTTGPTGTDPTSTLTASYYLDGLLASIDDGGRKVSYAYDGAGERTARVDAPAAGAAPGAAGTAGTVTDHYTYSDALVAVSATSSLTGGTATWSYDPVGRPVAATLPNGTSRAWGYAPDGALTSTSTSGPDGVIAAWDYTLDQADRITAAALSGPGAGPAAGTAAFGYDQASRVVSVTEPGQPALAVAYDADSNRLSYGAQQFTYRADDTVATATDPAGGNPQASTWTAFGALASDGCTDYGYDSFDRTGSVTVGAHPGTAGCPAGLPSTTSYTYDGWDRQASHTSTTAVGAVPAGVTVTVHDDATGPTVSAETALAVADTRYAPGPGGAPYAVDGPIPPAPPAPAGTSPGTRLEYLSDDGHTSITTTTDAAGALTCAVRYDPWGSPLAPDATTTGTPATGAPCTNAGGSTVTGVLYRGQRRDTSTGDYQLGARTYDPRRAAFTTADTYRTGAPTSNPSVGVDPLTANTYTYVNGDPLNYIDPSGHVRQISEGGSYENEVSGESAQRTCAMFQDAKRYPGAQARCEELVNNPQHIAPPEHRFGRWHNFTAGVGYALYDFGPKSFAWVLEHTPEGQIGKAAGLDLTDVAQEGQDKLLAAYGADTDSLQFQGGQLTVQVALTVSDAAGVAGAGVQAARAAKTGINAIKAARAAKSAGSVAAAEGAEGAATTGLRDAAESCANSFTADTPVLMADGKEEPIANVKVGDKVLATDPETGRTEARPVTALIRHSGKHTMVDLTFDDGSKITTTDHHPFWDATTRTFTDAIELHVGDRVLSDHGRTLTISEEHVYDRSLTAYNLQIDGIHTYYAGTTPVLVHNSCSMSNPSSFEGATRSEAEKELAANGWEDAGATARSGGVRWRQPGNISNQVRIMPGNPADLNLIKQGPYIRFSISGTKYGPFSLLDF